MPRSRRCADGGADLLQRDAGVEQTLDDLEDQDVAEGVEPLRAGAGGAAHGRLDQAGAGPVVELAVGDAGGVARGRTAVAGVARAAARRRRRRAGPAPRRARRPRRGRGRGGVGALLVLVATHSRPSRSVPPLSGNSWGKGPPGAGGADNHSGGVTTRDSSR